ncbi:MAG: DNA alkylation repair protein [Clostridiales bacterium]|nr:DNA alkylation repair protein [Clostridiales bacterium]
MDNIEKIVEERLFAMQDIKYREFNSGLIPNLPAEKFIGVRTPDLRGYAKELAGTPQGEEFIKRLPHKYHEENCLHGFIIEQGRDYYKTIDNVERFLPYIDNWATCDTITPKVFKKHLPELYEHILIWLRSEHTYTVRFGIKMLMNFYLDDHFKPEMPELVAGVRSDKYYIKMMAAWYFATALAKQYDATIPYITGNRLDEWTHNKTIQKAVERYRISGDVKDKLKQLRLKTGKGEDLIYD